MKKHEEVKWTLEEIEREFERSNQLYPLFHSNHEGYGVIKEELDELWDEIKASKDTIANEKMKEEAIQLAAMAVKFIVSLYEGLK